jgi:hypothetical protein
MEIINQFLHIYFWLYLIGIVIILIQSVYKTAIHAPIKGEVTGGSITMFAIGLSLFIISCNF